MSNFGADEPQSGPSEPLATAASVIAYRTRTTSLGPALTIQRALPIRDRRMVGPWCFLDRYGPLSFTAAKPMDVAPHPHIGLQTVSWLLDGEIIHHDSLDTEALLRPGHVGVMTAGRGIAHSEETPTENTGRLSGVQLWTALPSASHDTAPAFQHITEAPALEFGPARLSLFYGSLDGTASPAQSYSPAIGADLLLPAQSACEIPLDPNFEHALLLLDGRLGLEDQLLDTGVLYYLAPGRRSLPLRAHSAARTLLIGGQPFAEDVLLWWNFVARTSEEIAAARRQWAAGERFGPVRGYRGPRLTAPELLGRPIRSTGRPESSVRKS